MAERRMFSRKLMEEDAFLTLPAKSQLCYVHILLQADDDGFVDRIQAIRRILGGRERDIRELIDRGYLIEFPGGVAAVTHWRIHNRVRRDTYTPTKYTRELAQLDVDPSGAYRLRPDAVTDPSHPCHTGKERSGKDRSGEERKAALRREAAALGIGESAFPFLEEWFSYKASRGEDQSPSTVRSTLVQIKRNLDLHGETAVAELIRRSIQNGWKGIFFEHLRAPADDYASAEALYT